MIYMIRYGGNARYNASTAYQAKLWKAWTHRTSIIPTVLRMFSLLDIILANVRVRYSGSEVGCWLLVPGKQKKMIVGRARVGRFDISGNSE